MRGQSAYELSSSFTLHINTENQTESEVKHQNVRANVAAELRSLAIVLDPGNENNLWVKVRNWLIAFTKSAFRRLLIWFFSLFIAFYVPIHEVGFPYLTDKWTDKVGAAGKSTDVFLGVVAMVILSATDIIDGIISRREKKIDSFTVGSCWILIFIYALFIVFGMSAYTSPSAASQPPWVVFEGIICIGILGELFIANSAA